MLGWLASSTLKPQKNTNSNTASALTESKGGEEDEGATAATHIKPNCTSAISATAARNTARR